MCNSEINTTRIITLSVLVFVENKMRYVDGIVVCGTTLEKIRFRRNRDPSHHELESMEVEKEDTSNP